MKTRSLTLLAGIALVLTVSCTTASEPPAEAAVAELADGTLTVLVFPVLGQPFMSPNLAGGVLPERGGTDHFAGIDADLMARFAAEQGVEVEFVRLREPGFQALIPALLAGRGEVVVSGISITPERDRIVDFSQPYFAAATVIIARRDAQLHELADLEGKRAVAVNGSRPVEVLRQAGFDGSIREVDFQTDAYAEVSDGGADFAALESAGADISLNHSPDLEVAMVLPGKEGYGFAVAEGSALVPLLDRFIDDMRASGELDAILARHLPSPTASD